MVRIPWTIVFEIGEVCPVDFLRYFLALFPVLTLSSSFPIITVTLRNNLKSLFGRENDTGLFSRLFFPVLAMAPPVTLAAFTDDLETLVGITGRWIHTSIMWWNNLNFSYAGAFIQYVIPVALVYCSRRVIKTVFGDLTNKHRLKECFNAFCLNKCAIIYYEYANAHENQDRSDSRGMTFGVFVCHV